MKSRRSNPILAGLSVICSACSLLQDPGSLSSDYRATAGQSGATALASGGAATGGVAGLAGAAAGAAAGGAAGSAGNECMMSASDTNCDGLNQNCEPTVTDTGCPSGCKGIRYNGESYMACTTSVTFSDAEVLCEQQRMRLVQIDSVSENSFVSQTAQSLGSYIWIGGSDLTSLGTFSWQSGLVFYRNGTIVAGVYSNFITGQPTTAPG
ncbi:MAG TPA: C-type lectin domain-containing protein, partial [Polyangiaceae bacterium]|nr:C-type lectin domain-containing protein [Polyangiaceae bacterium]